MARIAIELNREVVRRSEWGSTMLKDEDRIEIVHFVGGGARVSRLCLASDCSNVPEEKLIIGGRAFTSRLIIGTGKYRSHEEMRSAHEASGAEMVTVAVRRVPLDRSSESFLDYLNPDFKFFRTLPVVTRLKTP